MGLTSYELFMCPKCEKPTRFEYVTGHFPYFEFRCLICNSRYYWNIVKKWEEMDQA